MQAPRTATPKNVTCAREALQRLPTNIPREGTSEGEDEEEEDIERLRDGAMKVATRVVAETYESNHLSSLEYVARGGYNHVWLVTYSMVSRPLSSPSSVSPSPWY
jgi:hypothetical protein